eukprot:Plantae.Rhodophyta-Rhodochaete_pulchella.ctg2064.p1 GENE.Plantae.Rhodophyta-Rhodochaete_pulchella.ctg2064~~Plantae.Rhodophyta-Rhodochaete_pulchella.ctg2064.p1  ORF type:complete len:287 (+),score=16.79 Plantae.Rhodophyta-Rhodochaete_pulchella.ctg2064:419-1279(+)
MSSFLILCDPASKLARSANFAQVLIRNGCQRISPLAVSDAFADSLAIPPVFAAQLSSLFLRPNRFRTLSRRLCFLAALLGEIGFSFSDAGGVEFGSSSSRPGTNGIAACTVAVLANLAPPASTGGLAQSTPLLRGEVLNLMAKLRLRVESIWCALGEAIGMATTDAERDMAGAPPIEGALCKAPRSLTEEPRLMEDRDECTRLWFLRMASLQIRNCSACKELDAESMLGLGVRDLVSVTSSRSSRSSRVTARFCPIMSGSTTGFVIQESQHPIPSTARLLVCERNL